MARLREFRTQIVGSTVALVTMGALWTLLGVHSGSDESISVPATARDFGEVWARDGFRWRLPISNPSDRDIEIRGFRTSCNCTSVDPETVTIPAHGKVDVYLTLDLLSKAGAVPGRKAPFSVTVRPLFADGRYGKPLRVNGTVRALYRFSQPVVRFDKEELVLGQEFPTRRVAVSAQIPLESLQAESAAAAVTVKPVRNGSHFELSITPDKTLTPGHHEFFVALKGRGRDNKAMPTVNLRVFAPVVEDIRALPDQLNLGILEIGSVASQEVVLSSRTGTQWTVQQIVVRDSTISVDAIDATASPRAFRVSVRGAARGAQRAVITFVAVQKTTGRSLDIPLAVTYHGV